MNVRIHEIVAQTQMIDGDSLLTPQVMARIVAAVLQALQTQDDDDKARRRDTQLSGGTCCDGQGRKGRP
jgi:hypothetical protein